MCKLETFSKYFVGIFSKCPLGLAFDADELRDKILRSNDNPIKKGYVVGVIVQTFSGKPAAYKILNLHDVIALETVAGNAGIFPGMCKSLGEKFGMFYNI